MSDKTYFENAYFIIGTAYAGKSTMVKELAKRHVGIACEENYHDNYTETLDAGELPCLTYTRDLEDWHDFIRRSPQEYKAWIDGVKKECEILELRMLTEICNQGKPVFVDTNISIATLKRIAPENHTLVMLADPMISVRRFFERPDPEKQFLYKLILEEPDPEYAMQNYRKGLELINSKETYDEFLNSGFTTILRDENRTIDETVVLLSKLHEAKHHINVKVDMDELDLTSAEAKATYKEIEEWVQEHYGFHVTNLNIAQVKQKHGIIERENYNKPKSENSRQPGCPEEKVKAIEEALKFFQMI